VDVVEGPTLISVDEIEHGVRLNLSDGETLELAAESLPPALPVAGEVVPPALLDDLREAAARKRIARRLFTLLGRRLHTRRTLSRKLREEGYPATAIDAVLERFAAEGIHSDRRFAEAWCRDTLRARPVGRRYLENKLRQQGVDADLAALVVGEQVDPEDDRQRCRQAAAKWWRRQRGAADLRALSRGQRFLRGRGFSPALSNQVIRATAPDREGDT